MNKFEIAEQINNKVNEDITYCRDHVNYKTEEFWCVPQGHLGDCEDYVLLKRQQLLDAGWDNDKINIVTCMANGEGHAVLYVQTDKGGFILDNCTSGLINPQTLNYNWLSLMRDGKWYELLGF